MGVACRSMRSLPDVPRRKLDLSSGEEIKCKSERDGRAKARVEEGGGERYRDPVSRKTLFRTRTVAE